MANQFIMFERFCIVCNYLSLEERKELIRAIVRYVEFEEEPDLKYPLNAIFVALEPCWQDGEEVA